MAICRVWSVIIKQLMDLNECIIMTFALLYCIMHTSRRRIYRKQFNKLVGKLPTKAKSWLHMNVETKINTNKRIIVICVTWYVTHGLCCCCFGGLTDNFMTIYWTDHWQKWRMQLSQMHLAFTISKYFGLFFYKNHWKSKFSIVNSMCQYFYCGCGYGWFACSCFIG